jgi:hypothetical protein
MCKKFVKENYNFFQLKVLNYIEDIAFLDQALTALFHVEIFPDNYYR